MLNFTIIYFVWLPFISRMQWAYWPLTRGAPQFYTKDKWCDIPPCGLCSHANTACCVEVLLISQTPHARKNSRGRWTSCEGMKSSSGQAVAFETLILCQSRLSLVCWHLRWNGLFSPVWITHQGFSVHVAVIGWRALVWICKKKKTTFPCSAGWDDIGIVYHHI